MILSNLMIIALDQELNAIEQFEMPDVVFT